MTESLFPDGFLWGTATSSYQIEGAVAEDGRSPSIWDTFSHTEGRIEAGDTGDHAADHYHRLGEDVAIMQSLGLNAYRFSIAWPRLLPDGVGEVNAKGVAFYRELCERLLEAGIAPNATLYHWDLPQALEDRGGWLNPESALWFAEYAATAKEALGDLISMWSTLNEPYVSSFLGYSSGDHAPGVTDPASAYVAAHHLLVAHHRGIRSLRDTSPRADDRLGIVLNLVPARPASQSVDDGEAAAAVDAIQNDLFLQTVFTGEYPERIREHHKRFGGSDRIDPADLASVREDIDWLGVNYYNVNTISYREGQVAHPLWPGTDGSHLEPPPGRLTEMGWGVEPDGLRRVLLRAGRHAAGIPLYVCESGAAYPDEVAEDGSVRDTDRIEYLAAHTAAVAAAIEQGADVRGYFVWSLLDNFEWAFGYRPRFGVVRVDPDTRDRTVKDSGYWYRDFIAAQGESGSD